MRHKQLLASLSQFSKEDVQEEEEDQPLYPEGEFNLKIGTTTTLLVRC